MPERIDILGIGVDPLTIDQAVAQIIALVAAPKAAWVAKPYVEFIERAVREPSYRELLNQADLVLPDGVALQWTAYYQTLPKRGAWQLFSSLAQIMLRPNSMKKVLPERFAGVDATWRLLQQCQARQLRVFLIGSPIGTTIEATAQAIRHHLPQIIIAGTAPGELGGLRGEALYQNLLHNRIDLTDLANQIEQSQADIILTGIGFPQQEALNAVLAARLNHGVLVGEGGTFDFESFGGKRRRAPRWMRRSGLEWLWRLILEPSRWQRQLAIPRFIWRVWRTY